MQKGMGEYLLRSGTITTAEDACPFKHVKLGNAFVVRVSVGVKTPAELPYLVSVRSNLFAFRVTVSARELI